MGQAAARVNESSRARGAPPSRWPAGRYAFSSWDYRELSENQVRLHGALPPDRGSDEAQLALLEPETRELIADTERLHQRIARLDESWRQHFEMTSPVRAFQDRIGREFGRLG